MRCAISNARRVSWASPTAARRAFRCRRKTPPAPITGCTGEDCALARRFAHAVYRALFVDDRDISAPAVVLEIAANLGVDRALKEVPLGGDRLDTALQSPEIKGRLKEEVDNALRIGLFGSPHVIIDGEAFFGADRLPQIERWLETGGF